MFANLTRNYLAARQVWKVPAVSRALSDKIIDPPGNEPDIPPVEINQSEPVKVKRARLLYQSRKRGILENDLLLSTFAGRYLSGMSNERLHEYDCLINLAPSDWDIYYWAVGAKPVPQEFDTEVMRMLQKHTRNDNREQRFRQPALPLINS